MILIDMTLRQLFGAPAVRACAAEDGGEGRMAGAGRHAAEPALLSAPLAAP